MIEFVRTIHKHVEDVFILDVEALCNLLNQLQESIPYPVGDAELLSAQDDITEESADCFVVGKSLGYGKKVILHGRDSRAGNLGGKVSHLVLAQAEVLLSLLEYDFQGPTHGVNPIGLLETQCGIGRNDAVPLGLLVPPGEEEPHVAAGKPDIHGDVVASQLTAPFASVLGAVEPLGKLLGREFLTFIYVLRLAHLDHAQVVALRVAGRDELDDFGTCEPAVGQHVVEVDLLLDDALDHLRHQRNLACVVLLQALGRGTAIGSLFGETGIKLLLLQVVVALFPLLADEAEVEQHLRLSVGDAEEQSLEAEYHRVGDMRVNLPNKFRLDASFGEVRVVHHQADRGIAVGHALFLGLTPQLRRDRAENLPPVVRLVGEESVEHILLAVEQAA